MLIGFNDIPNIMAECKSTIFLIYHLQVIAKLLNNKTSRIRDSSSILAFLVQESKILPPFSHFWSENPRFFLCFRFFSPIIRDSSVIFAFLLQESGILPLPLHFWSKNPGFSTPLSIFVIRIRDSSSHNPRMMVINSILHNPFGF